MDSLRVDSCSTAPWRVLTMLRRDRMARFACYYAIPMATWSVSRPS